MLITIAIGLFLNNICTSVLQLEVVPAVAYVSFLATILVLRYMSASEMVGNVSER